MFVPITPLAERGNGHHSKISVVKTLKAFVKMSVAGQAIGTCTKFLNRFLTTSYIFSCNFFYSFPVC